MRPSATQAAVEARALSKSFGNGAVISDVSFRVERGTCFGLLGPNGTGKTTTLKIIYGSLRPSAGTAFIDGVDITRKPKEVKGRLGVVPQENTLDPDLSAWQNLAFHARYARLPRESARHRIGRLCDIMGLNGHTHAPVAELSSGLRRRLVLARALIGEPTTVILDEPTSGLDRGSREIVLGLLHEMKRKGTTFILATHDLEDAGSFCDSAALIEGGRIVETGTGCDMARQAAGLHGGVPEDEGPR